MAAPSITWWDETSTTQLASWPIGVIDAGSVSGVKEFHIWNNKGGLPTNPISDAVNCFVTTKDTAGGNGAGTTAADLIAGMWLNACCLSAGKNPALPTDWVPVGGDIHAEVRGGGAAATTPGLLRGIDNDGTIANATANFVVVQAKVLVPSTAMPGRVDFLFRFGYQYV